MTDYLCNLIIPGAAKSGTSSLHVALGLHPKICMSSSKEPHYFCRESNYSKGSQYHNFLFEHMDAEVFGESSTGYFIWPNAIRKIKNDLRDPKIIIILRDPVQRAFSHYRWRVRLGLEKRSLLECLTKDGYGYDPEKPDRFGYMAYLQFSKYSKYCPMWVEAFGQKNCLMINSNDFRRKYSETLHRCFRFLGLEEISVGKPMEDNRTDAVTLRPPAHLRYITSRAPERIKRSRVLRGIHDGILRRFSPTSPQSLTDEEKQYLREELREDIDYFNNLFS